MTFDMLASGETTGIFQLESAGMRRYIKELKPTTIFDLMAMVALYRPGPMQVIPEFISRKHDASKITYPDPRLKEVLRESYGIIAFQDDVLLTAITLAGYSWGDADKLRKAVGKKIATEMKKQKEKFIEGCVVNGLPMKKAEEIFHLIEPFAGYGFNKAHAACYAMIAYQTAYLKANYPVEYMTAVLTAESRANTGPVRDEKMTSIVSECRRMNLSILPPDVNKSTVDFCIENGAIRFGLAAVKNVGTAGIDSIILARNSDGTFKRLLDFVSRVDLSKVNRKTLESLIKTGAMDAFGKRSAMLSAIPLILDQAHKSKKSVASGQGSLFGADEDEHGVFDIEIPDIPEMTQKQILALEKEFLGFYLTAHPLEPLRNVLSLSEVTKIADIISSSVGDRVTIGGIIVSVKKIMTKANNSEMAFCKIEDFTGTIEVVVFPKTYQRVYALIVPDSIVYISGKVDEKENQMTILSDDVRVVDTSQ